MRLARIDVTLDTFAILAGSTMIAAFVQGSSGVGFALVLAPVLAFVAPELLPVCLLALMIPLNVYVAWRERAAIDRHGVGWITLGRFVGTFGGVWLLAAFAAGRLQMLIGAMTVIAAAATLLLPAFRPGRNSFVAVGVATGISETATGIGGPPLALAYQHRSATTLRSTLALCFLLGQLMSLVVLAVAGRVTGSALTAAVLLAPPLLIGAASSHAVHGRLSGRALRTFVLAFAMASGALLLVRA